MSFLVMYVSMEITSLRIDLDVSSRIVIDSTLSHRHWSDPSQQGTIKTTRLKNKVINILPEKNDKMLPGRALLLTWDRH